MTRHLPAEFGLWIVNCKIRPEVSIQAAMVDRGVGSENPGKRRIPLCRSGCEECLPKGKTAEVLGVVEAEVRFSIIDFPRSRVVESKEELSGNAFNGENELAGLPCFPSRRAYVLVDRQMWTKSCTSGPDQGMETQDFIKGCSSTKALYPTVMPGGLLFAYQQRQCCVSRRTCYIDAFCLLSCSSAKSRGFGRSGRSRAL